MWHKLSVCILAMLTFAAHAETSTPSDTLVFDHFDCHSTGKRQAQCKIFLKGEVAAKDMLYLTNVYDVDRLEFHNTRLGQTGYRYQGRFYARFLPRTYSLQNIIGEKNPVLTLNTESFFADGSGLFDNSIVKVVSSDKEWALQAKTLWLRFVLAILCFTGILFAGWLCITPNLVDGWLWRATELRVFYVTAVVAIFYNSEWPKLLVPSVLSPEQYLNSQAFIWTLVIWSLSQLLCESIFSDPSALERIRSRSTWLDKILTYAAGFFLVSAIILSPLAHSYGMAVQLIGLGAIAFARVWQTRFSRILRRAHLASIYLYVSLLGFTASLLLCSIIEPRWIYAPSSPLTAIGVLTLWSIARRHYFLRSVKAECRDFLRYCRNKLLETTSGRDRAFVLTQSVQEHWDGARVSLVSIRGETALLLASSGPLALTNPALDSRRAGPLVRRVCREKHILYAPVSEELGRDLANQGLRYSTVAIPIHEVGEVRAVMLFMAHENERIPPRDALAIQWMGESMGLEIACAAQQMMAEKNTDQLAERLRLRDGLALEELDAWGRAVENTDAQSARRVVVCVNEPHAGDEALAESICAVPALFRCHNAFISELNKLWHNTRTQFEFLRHEQAGQVLYVAPKKFTRPEFANLEPERVAIALAYQLSRQAIQLCSEERYRILHLEAPQIGVWAGPVGSFALQEFCRRICEKNASPSVDTTDDKLRFLLEECPSLQVKIKRAA